MRIEREERNKTLMWRKIRKGESVPVIIGVEEVDEKSQRTDGKEGDSRENGKKRGRGVRKRRHK